jgi:hypothetical protein
MGGKKKSQFCVAVCRTSDRRRAVSAGLVTTARDSSQEKDVARQEKDMGIEAAIEALKVEISVVDAAQKERIRKLTLRNITLEEKYKSLYSENEGLREEISKAHQALKETRKGKMK